MNFKKILANNLYPLIVAITILVLTTFIIIWSSAYINPMGGIPSIWRDSKITDLQTYTLNIGKTWDTRNYTTLVHKGYRNSSIFAFFPLLPMQIWATSKITSLSPEISAILVSIFNYLIFVLILYQFLRRYLQFKGLESTISLNSILLTILFLPFSLFWSLAYTESIFTAILLAIFYIIFLNKSTKLVYWCFIPILAFLLTLTRSTGVMLAPVFIFIILNKIIVGLKTQKFKEIIKSQWKQFSILILATITNIAGLLSFMYYGYLKTGDFWKSRNVQADWGRGSTWNIFKPIYNNFVPLVDKTELNKICNGYTDCYYSLGYTFVGAIIIFICLMLSLRYFTKTTLDRSMILFSVLASILPLTTDLMMSFNRYIIIAPIYFLFLPILLHRFIPKEYINILQMVFIMIQTVFIIFFGSHFWIG